MAKAAQFSGELKSPSKGIQDRTKRLRSTAPYIDPKAKNRCDPIVSLQVWSFQLGNEMHI